MAGRWPAKGVRHGQDQKPFRCNFQATRAAGVEIQRETPRGKDTGQGTTRPKTAGAPETERWPSRSWPSGAMRALKPARRRARRTNTD